jgi:peptide/nickel transport system permease protein
LGSQTVIIRSTKRSRLWVAWVKFSTNRAAFIGLVVLLTLAVLAVLTPFLSLDDPLKANLARALEPPSPRNILGTDELGRDILSRLLHGIPVSLGIALLSVALGASVGVPLGLVSGYFSGRVDSIIQRITDIMLAFPPILLALALVAAIGVGIQNVIIAVGISTIPVYVKLTRGQVLALREEEFIKAAVLLGLSSWRIMWKYIMPNVVPVIIVQSTYYLGFTILTASGLGFLGLGVQPPTPEWGAMLGSGRTYIFSSPHVSVFPGLMIFLSVIAFNLLGDGLRDALDPRTQLRLKTRG